MAVPVSKIPRSNVNCLLVAPLDPLTGQLRAGPFRRYLHPPPQVAYSLATDRMRYPHRAARYKFDPSFVGLAAVRFAIEHVVPLHQRGYDLAHSFFLDLRAFKLPWVHESDQSFGQFLSGYVGVEGFLKRRAMKIFSTYLNSRDCRAVIAWSKWAKEGFIQDGVAPSKIHVIPPPFEIIHDRRDHSGCNVLFIGRDFIRKGGDIALRAFSSVCAPKCRLLYVGETGDVQSRKAIRKSASIIQYANPSAETLREEVWPITDVFILPTRRDAFAISMIEAMCRGIPVIASALPSISEIVRNEDTGLLTRVGDAEGVSQRLRLLVEDRPRRRKIGNRARSMVHRAFSPRVIGSTLTEVYCSAIR